METEEEDIEGEEETGERVKENENTTYSNLGEWSINYQIFINWNFIYKHKPNALKYVK